MNLKIFFFSQISDHSEIPVQSALLCSAPSYPWNPLRQYSHSLSSLLFSHKNPTEAIYLTILLGYPIPNQEPLVPLACTATRCMSLVGTSVNYVCSTPIFVGKKLPTTGCWRLCWYPKSLTRHRLTWQCVIHLYIVMRFNILTSHMQDLGKRRRKQRRPTTSTVSSLMLQLALSVLSLRFFPPPFLCS